MGVCDSQLIDEIGIKKANKEAMRRALHEIVRKIPRELEINAVVVDGNDKYQFVETVGREAVSVIKGDAKVPEISGASILAKVFRDKIVDQYALLYPHLGLDSHKGYGTKKHSDAISDPSRLTGAHRYSYAPVKAAAEKKPKLLLHVCCGPDATVPIMDLKKDYDLVCFWYDPNIQPKDEYDKRLEAFKKVCEIEEVPFIEGEYDVANFLAEIKGLEHTPEKGEKCAKCYDMRLRRTAELAVEMGIRHFSSTLNNSPHKDLAKMFDLGDKNALSNNLVFLKEAFRKNGGFDRSVEYTKKHQIYRQNYCGCVFSETFPKPGAETSEGEWRE